MDPQTLAQPLIRNLDVTNTNINIESHLTASKNYNLILIVNKFFDVLQQSFQIGLVCHGSECFPACFRIMAVEITYITAI
jgi:hypothetical protein